MSDKLPDEILKTLATEPIFIEVVERCLDESELVSNFSRIYGVDLPRKPTSPLIEMVDQATGFREYQFNEFFTAFIPFVYRCVWLPLYSKGKLGG
ncbi:hypothetical protein AB7W40_22675 [Providencia rettgeri]